MRRSACQDSSGWQISFRYSPVFPGPINVYETAERGEDRAEKYPTEIENRKKLLVTGLAYMNKPEVPILLIESIAAVIHGADFPIFGVLLLTSINMSYKPVEEPEKDSKFLDTGLGLISLFTLPIQNYLFGFADGKLTE